MINDIREKIKEKQKAFNTATIQIIVALLVYVISMLIHNRRFNMSADKDLEAIKNGCGLDNSSTSNGDTQFATKRSGYCHP